MNTSERLPDRTARRTWLLTVCMPVPGPTSFLMHVTRIWAILFVAATSCLPMGIAAAQAPTPTPTPAILCPVTPPPVCPSCQTGGVCVGDCNGDGAVTSDELSLACDIAAGNQPISVCAAADANRDGLVSLDELNQIACNTFNGCPPPCPAPTNDNFAAATVIVALPFSDSVDNTTATIEPGEPQSCDFLARTVWYSFTPTVNTVVRADMAGSSFFDTHLNVYQAVAPGLGGLSFLNCAEFGRSLTFTAQAGTTYYLQAGDVFTGGGSLEVNLQAILPPSNDNFAEATVISALPFTDSVDTTAASFEAGEPPPSCFNAQNGTVWYAFTPGASESISASINASFPTVVAVYTGSSLTSLTGVACQASGGVLTFQANAGTTYFFQVAGLFGESGPLQFNLSLPPPPVASFAFFPSDPSVFDLIQFYDTSFDPAGAGFESFTWDFGDGTTATDGSPTHQYAADGDYTVQHEVTTVDGRTASTSQIVHVQTHDVAITRFSTPNAAKAGQTRSISVGVNSNRYPETVEVDLFKSAPGGFVQIGSLTQFVPVRSSNRTTDFDFSYTFTSADATIGKVTFEAVATIIGARDALSADNTAISSPTKVNR